MEMINFIIYSSAMEHPNDRRVSELRFYKSFQKNTSLFKTHRFDSLARTDSFLPKFLHKEDICSLKFRFLSISKPSNFCLLLSQIFCSLYQPKHFFFYNQKLASDTYLGLNSCFYFQTIQQPESYRALAFLLKNLVHIASIKSCVICRITQISKLRQKEQIV